MNTGKRFECLLIRYLFQAVGMWGTSVVLQKNIL